MSTNVALRRRCHKHPFFQSTDQQTAPPDDATE
jgi:hypothetical protein